MKTAISSKSDSIQATYDNYVKGQFIVNRRYQRKLVWTQEEKIAFIDSIYNHYSVPLILVADISNKNTQKYEIIDGMQRLNAIMSFIENEFPINVDGKDAYFNLDTLAHTIDRREKKLLTQKTPVLERDICMDIVSYQLPFTYVTADTEDVEEIFRRINSYGRQLSDQEIRQAGALGAFPTMVRLLSSQIRGDVSTSDSVDLCNMRYISLSNTKLDYGIKMEDTFWVKQKIVTIPRMRVSRDEELIAWVLAYIILGESVSPSAKTLDRLYRHQDAESKRLAKDVETKIVSFGEEKIKTWFMDVFSTLKTVIESSGKDFRSFIYTDDDGEGLVRTFQVIYLAFFELMIKESMVISNMKLLISLLDGIGLKHLQGISSNNWNAKYRKEKIDSIAVIIKKAFKKSKGSDVAYENWAFQLDNILHLSITEGNQYDFKMGFHDLKKGENEVNKRLIRKCVEILTAEVNKKAQTSGYVIVGVTEGESALNSFKKFYSKSDSYTPVSNTHFYVTGIEDELKMFYNNEGDKFVREIKKEIEGCPIESIYKTMIQQDLKLVTYGGHVLLVLYLKSEDAPIFYDKKLYIRKGTDTEYIEDAATLFEYMNKFKA